MINPSLLYWCYNSKFLVILVFTWNNIGPRTLFTLMKKSSLIFFFNFTFDKIVLNKSVNLSLSSSFHQKINIHVILNQKKIFKLILISTNKKIFWKALTYLKGRNSCKFSIKHFILVLYNVRSAWINCKLWHTL